MKTRNFPLMNVVFILLALSAARAHKNIHRVNKNDLHRIVKSKFKIFFSLSSSDIARERTRIQWNYVIFITNVKIDF